MIKIMLVGRYRAHIMSHGMKNTMEPLHVDLHQILVERDYVFLLEQLQSVGYTILFTDRFSLCGCLRRQTSHEGARESEECIEMYELHPPGGSKKTAPSGKLKTTTSFTEIFCPVDCDVSHKILLLGDSEVGKTSIVKHLMKQPFNSKERSTIGKHI